MNNQQQQEAQGVKFQQASWQEYSSSKILPLERLLEKIPAWRRQKKTIATLNGSFDLLHAGHMYIIYEAAKRADLLIVAVNSDASIKAYKSQQRPIIPLRYRLEILSAIGFIDYLTWFDETDPRQILEKIRPDVHVNGAEYGANCIEAEVVKKHGGELHLVERIPGLATSEILASIKRIASCD
jgi:D-glycero-beta-D-manno-heptose 1-phosphate adenylyltransferase